MKVGRIYEEVERIPTKVERIWHEVGRIFSLSAFRLRKASVCLWIFGVGNKTGKVGNKSVKVGNKQHEVGSKSK